FFFFQAEDGIRDGHVTGVQTCALPIFGRRAPEGAGADLPAAQGRAVSPPSARGAGRRRALRHHPRGGRALLTVTVRELLDAAAPDRKSTRLNSSHVAISYAVFCLKKKK